MNNVYGTKRPANITSDDVDIYYSYRPSRAEDSAEYSTFKKLDSKLLMNTSGKTDNGNAEVLPGMFDLRLPLDVFGNVGIYTIYIKPKEIRTTILHVSTLAAYPDVRGIVLDTKGMSNGSLVGYRIEYFNESGDREDDFRIITSNNRCEPVAQVFNDTTQNGVRYRFNDAASLMFCTVTPSTSLSFNNNTLPNIGAVGQEIALINTKFNPMCIEVEMVENDAETIATMLNGDQIRDLEHATITTFNKAHEPFSQFSYYTSKNKLGKAMYEIKVKEETTENSLDYKSIVNPE
nr:MAG TPA: hypothetical protein [Caudoviricetes sp.]